MIGLSHNAIVKVYGSVKVRRYNIAVSTLGRVANHKQIVSGVAVGVGDLVNIAGVGIRLAVFIVA